MLVYKYYIIPENFLGGAVHTCVCNSRGQYATICIASLSGEHKEPPLKAAKVTRTREAHATQCIYNIYIYILTYILIYPICILYNTCPVSYRPSFFFFIFISLSTRASYYTLLSLSFSTSSSTLCVCVCVCMVIHQLWSVYVICMYVDILLRCI